MRPKNCKKSKKSIEMPPWYLVITWNGFYPLLEELIVLGKAVEGDPCWCPLLVVGHTAGNMVIQTKIRKLSAFDNIRIISSESGLSPPSGSCNEKSISQSKSKDKFWTVSTIAKNIIKKHINRKSTIAMEIIIL